MRKIYCLFFCFLCFSAFAQRLEWQGNKLTQRNRYLTLKEAAEILRINPESVPYINQALSQNTTAGILGAIGGAGIGWPIGEALAGAENPTWILAGIGALFIGAAIPISISANNNAKQAVALYNASLDAAIYRPQLEVKFTNTGMGLVYSF